MISNTDNILNHNCSTIIQAKKLAKDKKVRFSEKLFEIRIIDHIENKEISKTFSEINN